MSKVSCPKKQQVLLSGFEHMLDQQSQCRMAGELITRPRFSWRSSGGSKVCPYKIWSRMKSPICSIFNFQGYVDLKWLYSSHHVNNDHLSFILKFWKFSRRGKTKTKKTKTNNNKTDKHTKTLLFFTQSVLRKQNNLCFNYFETIVCTPANFNGPRLLWSLKTHCFKEMKSTYGFLNQ